MRKNRSSTAPCKPVAPRVKIELKMPDWLKKNVLQKVKNGPFWLSWGICIEMHEIAPSAEVLHMPVSM